MHSLPTCMQEAFPNEVEGVRSGLRPVAHLNSFKRSTKIKKVKLKRHLVDMVMFKDF